MSIAFFQDIIESVESLSIEEQDYLFNLIYQRRIEKRRQEIAKNGEETLKALAMRTAKKGSAEEIMAYLLKDEEE
ncbi:MAG: hypothetical protein ACKO2T_01085 [Microcystis aeruginosa]